MSLALRLRNRRLHSIKLRLRWPRRRWGRRRRRRLRRVQDGGRADDGGYVGKIGINVVVAAERHAAATNHLAESVAELQLLSYD